MKILWVINVPSPYRVDFFSELGKYCELTVLFEKFTSTERDESWSHHHFVNFTGVIMKGIPVDVDKAVCLGMIKYLKKEKYDFIVVSNIATPTGIIAIEYMKLRKIPYLLEGDGGFPKNGKGLKEAYKKHLIKGAAGYFSTSQSHDEYFLTYGAKKEKVFRYPFTSLRDQDISSHLAENEEKLQLKKELGAGGGKVILSVGQFIDRKGYDILFRSCKDIRPNLDIYIVGGKPTEKYISLIKDLDLNNVHFVEFKSREELSNYYRMADLFVLPTREDIWGLVVNEAMAHGLPVVTTDKCIAGVELIRNYENGFLIPSEDPEALAEKISEILEDADLRLKMANNNRNKIREYTIETMVKRHIDVFMTLKEENK
ncbi:glycosyltransferase family 4 protein [Anaerocolumna sp.]|uniref:glycosyltransferase family 4 protein n=1 Tax=Anaerocolumna sp. TaxID=2041569 RepID=UPI0028ADFBA1|nr:glycosyltransferase family 4 protein [Anaerocolumna sp.]